MVIQNRQKIVFSKYCPLKESHWSCFPKVSMRKLRNYTGSGAGAGGGGEGGGGGLGERLRRVQRHVQLQHQRSLPGAAAPGQVQYLRCIYIIYILSTTIYRSGLVPLLPGGCLVPDGAADSANNRNTRGLGPNMRRRQSLPIGQHTPELVCSYISNCEVFIPFQLTLFLYYFQQRTT